MSGRRLRRGRSEGKIPSSSWRSSISPGAGCSSSSERTAVGSRCSSIPPLVSLGTPVLPGKTDLSLSPVVMAAVHVTSAGSVRFRGAPKGGRSTKNLSRSLAESRRSAVGERSSWSEGAPRSFPERFSVVHSLQQGRGAPAEALRRSGEIRPKQGKARPLWGRGRPISGDGSPIWGSHRPGSGEPRPIWGKSRPFWGSRRPI